MLGRVHELQRWLLGLRYSRVILTSVDIRLFPQTNYITLDCSAPPHQSILGAPCTHTQQRDGRPRPKSTLPPKTPPGTGPMKFTPHQNPATSPFLSSYSEQGSFPTPHTMHLPQRPSSTTPQPPLPHRNLHHRTGPIKAGEPPTLRRL